MIARTWRGATRVEAGQEYVEYLSRTGFSAFAATSGNRGALGLRRIRDGKAEFFLISLWDSPAAVTRFAGPVPDQAVFYPEDERFLVERDATVDHFEVVYADVRTPAWWQRLARWWLRHAAALVRDARRDGWRLAAFR